MALPATFVPAYLPTRRTTDKGKPIVCILRTGHNSSLYLTGFLLRRYDLRQGARASAQAAHSG